MCSVWFGGTTRSSAPWKKITGAESRSIWLLFAHLRHRATSRVDVELTDRTAALDASVGREAALQAPPPEGSQASSGNLALSCGVGNPAGLRGLPDGAEGIRTSDLRSAGTAPGE